MTHFGEGTPRMPSAAARGLVRASLARLLKCLAARAAGPVKYGVIRLTNMGPRLARGYRRSVLATIAGLFCGHLRETLFHRRGTPNKYGKAIQGYTLS